MKLTGMTCRTIREFTEETMPRYNVMCTWEESGIMEIEADSEEEAREKAYAANLPWGDYVDDSFSVWDIEKIPERREMNRKMKKKAKVKALIRENARV